MATLNSPPIKTAVSNIASRTAIAIGLTLSSQLAIASIDIDVPQLDKAHRTKQQTIQYAIRQAEQQDLANHISWQRLLYYPDTKQSSKANSASNSNHRPKRSKATKSEFFVSADGQYNANNELKSMLTALLSPADANKGNQSVQCRFPARTHWLKQQLQLSLPKANCPDYQRWYQKYHPKQLSVVFAQEYPDQLPSAFAHTLLKIETTTNTNYALNYTVGGDTTDSKLAYGVKAMTGDYAGDMSIQPYQKSLDNYLNVHQRDVWTYPLQLTQEESEQLLRHIWEVKDLQLPYYFLTDNCASEILRLIDMVKAEQALYSKVGKVAIPGEIMRLLDSQSLLKAGRFHPAQKTEQQSRLNQDKHSDKNTNVSFNNAFADDNPITGSHSRRASIGIGRVSDYNYQQLGLRLSYHDLLDNPSGYRQNLDMDGLRIKIRYYNDGSNDPSNNNLSSNNSNLSKPPINDINNLQLQEFILMRGRSYHPINTARKGKSWGMELSAIQVNDPSLDYNNTTIADHPLSQQHLVGNIRFEQGLSYAFGKPKSRYDLPPQLCYALANGSAQVGKGIYKGFRIGAGASLGCTYQLVDKFRVTGELNLPYWYHGTGDTSNHKQGYWQPIASLGMQYDVAKNHGIRLTASHEFNRRIAEDTDVQLAWQWYF